ncbi:UNVERIFIED_CONTAM: LisH domain-containing protein, partial [Bacteroidetes bacterium 56_B9]
HLINRAIAMHLLREGKFDVAKTFVREVKEHPPAGTEATGTEFNHAAGMDWIEDLADVTMQDSSEDRLETEGERSGLQQKFADM